MRAAIAAAAPELFELVYQAQWIVEGCWEDIAAEQFAILDKTEANIRTLYRLRTQENADA